MSGFCTDIKCLPSPFAYVILVMCLAGAAQATAQNSVSVERRTFREQPFITVTVNPDATELQLLWKRADGEPFSTLTALRRWATEKDRELLFATNASIFSQDYTPGGLHIENGRLLSPLNLRDGAGNFHLKPNGVFLVDKTGPRIVESSEYKRLKPSPKLATQSGPLLVCDGTLHPKFQEGSTNLYIRSGVGVDEEGQVVFALSLVPVNLHTFASLFRNDLACPDALYLDGSISQFLIGERLVPDAPRAGFVGMLAVFATPDPHEDCPDIP